MTPGMAAMIREHWQHVESASGQPFDFGFFDREGFVYDTEPACRAVVTGRGLNPDLALPFLASIQGAFYRDGRDVTSSDVLAAIAAEEGYDRGSFMEAFAGDETREATATDFATAAGLGVRGFPTLIGHAGERHTALAVGYSPLAEVQRRVEGWLATADPLPSRTSSS
jgi:putative protein-disulfide isomerase